VLAPVRFRAHPCRGCLHPSASVHTLVAVLAACPQAMRRIQFSVLVSRIVLVY
jgi:hypothetical protein